MSDHVLWGRHPLPEFSKRLKITAGTLAHCRAEKALRKAEGWSDFSTLARGVSGNPEDGRR